MQVAAVPRTVLTFATRPVSEPTQRPSSATWRYGVTNASCAMSCEQPYQCKGTMLIEGIG